jgi:hypothetical protein
LSPSQEDEKRSASTLLLLALDAHISRDAATVFLPIRASVGIAIEILNRRSPIAPEHACRLRLCNPAIRPQLPLASSVPSVPQFATLLPAEVLKFRKLKVVVSYLAGLQSNVQASRIQSFKVRSTSILGL